MKEKDYLKKLATNIKKTRQGKKMTQVDLAYACNFEKQNMARIEAGKTSPTLKTLLKISEALEVDLKDLLPKNLD